MKTFRVNVNSVFVTAFFVAYAGYITNWRISWFNDRIFTLQAPEFIYNEICGLSDHFIEII